MHATLLILPFVLCSFARADEAATAYKALLAEYEKEGGSRTFAPRFIEFAGKHTESPTAVDALLWVVQKVRGRSETTQALALLEKHHRKSDKLAPACEAIASARSTAAEKLLRTLVEKSPHAKTRAQASFYLAKLLDREAELVQQLREEPDLAPRVLQYYGKQYGRHLASLDPAKLDKQRDAAWARVLNSFPGVETDDGTMGQIARNRLFAIRHLSVGKPAPEIVGRDILGKPLKLSDYRGKVVLLTFWGHW